ncbi:MAG: YigZ family protein, partial [Gemmatimonadetes bacterium]|nr:YigZ family protein [Gemmatimonadota bacterium]
FIAITRPVSDLAQAAGYREAERRRFYDATHHVYAALLRGGDQRFDDDGEPSGTAGRPTLAAIERAGLSDVAVIVTRYFGGTRLGTGGLGRAYGEAADLALERTAARTVVPGRRVLLKYSYADTGAVTRSVEANGATRLHERYGDLAELEVALPAARVEVLRAEVTETTGGRAELVELPGEMLLPVDT